MIIYHHPDTILHKVPTGHPERPERILTLHDMIDDRFPSLTREHAPLTDYDTLGLVHHSSYLESLFDACPEQGLQGIDGDTYLSPKSLEVAMRGVGAACASVDDVMMNKSQTAFVAMRPPGHHAEPDKAMGFCFFSNAAIAARYAQKQYGIGHVAVLDFDVHHGNGTQAAFWDDKSCLYASTHEMPLFPGSGAQSEEGCGNVYNLPLRARMNGQDVLDAWRRLLSQLEAQAPELIIISAGFDAHADDPLASIEMQATDFYELTSMITEFADKVANGRVISLLEGGYNLDALASSAEQHLCALQGLPRPS